MDDMLAQEYAEEIGAMVASLTEEREAVALEISGAPTSGLSETTPRG